MRFETSVIQKIQRTQDIINIRFNKPKDYIEVTKKHTSDEFADALAALKVGDKATVTAPFGDFTFKEKYDTLVQFSRRNNLEALSV